MRRLEHVLKEKGYAINIEPCTPIEQGLKIPDLCAWRSDDYLVCEKAVTSDVFNLEYDRKVSKYYIQVVHKWMLKNAPVGTQRLHPDVNAFCNWRGVMAEKSLRFWRDCGIPRSSFMNIVLSALQHSYKIWTAHK